MNHYQILGLIQGASVAEVKSAYRKLAFQYHPDRNPGDTAAAVKFKQIKEAFDSLMGKSSRPTSTPPQKPAKTPKSSPKKEEDLKIYVVPPKFDLWGKPLSKEEQEDWIRINQSYDQQSILNKPKMKPQKKDSFLDAFANEYEDSSQPNIR